ncbi:MAG: CHAD domain-containing protein [Solirubrobacteraceae bacterium]
MSTAAAAKVDVPLAYDQRSDAAAGEVLRRLLGVITQNLEGAVSGEDPEHLHQLRIAVRRSRTVQRQLKGAFPSLQLPGFRSEFRWLQRATGEARDLDVYVLEFESLRQLVPLPLRPDLDPLVPVLAHWRLAARAESARSLGSRRFIELVADWDQLLESLVECPLDDRPIAKQPIGPVVGKRIQKVYERVRTMGAMIDENSAAEDFHELRKKGKELRYLLELFGTRLFDEQVTSPLVKTLKGLQDVLGRHQDREVQIAMLRSLVDEVATAPGGPRACMAMGVLVDRLQADEAGARREFAERFAPLAQEFQSALVSETFV